MTKPRLCWCVSEDEKVRSDVRTHSAVHSCFTKHQTAAAVTDVLLVQTKSVRSSGPGYM